MTHQACKPGRCNEKQAAVMAAARAAKKYRALVAESTSPDIRRRPGTLAEVMAIVPTHRLDILVAMWRESAFERSRACSE